MEGQTARGAAGEGGSRKPMRHEYTILAFTARARRAHLQNLPLEILQRLCFDTAADDAGKAQQPHDRLHVCALGNELLDSGQLCGKII